MQGTENLARSLQQHQLMLGDCGDPCRGTGVCRSMETTDGEQSCRPHGVLFEDRITVRNLFNHTAQPEEAYAMRVQAGGGHLVYF